MRRLNRHLIGAASPLALVGGAGRSLAAEIDVVVSIKPVHSLVAGVMQGVGEPGLLVKGTGSEHSYSLRPSEARALERAEWFFGRRDDGDLPDQAPCARWQARRRSSSSGRRPA